ncbi:hypothetical protein AA0472_1491 [Acetobacter estunensis NRIC 0472]|nr:hypothetical protein AA0472_1491 [Acetobacter estunensis NRIC 0472]
MSPLEAIRPCPCRDQVLVNLTGQFLSFADAFEEAAQDCRTRNFIPASEAWLNVARCFRDQAAILKRHISPVDADVRAE